MIKVARIVSTQKANCAADLLFYCAAYRGGNTTVMELKLLSFKHACLGSGERRVGMSEHF